MILSEKSVSRARQAALQIYIPDSANSDSKGAEESVLTSEMSSYLGR